MSAYFILIYAVCGIYMLLNFKHDLQMLQQNSYRASRYWKWVRPHIGDAWRLTDIACIFLVLATRLLDIRISALAVTLVAIAKSILILRRKSKKPLVFTSRVKRLYFTSSLLCAGAVVACAVCTAGHIYGTYTGPSLTIALIFTITAFSWAVTIMSLWMLTPVEKIIQRRYINDARRILASMPSLEVVGITGSYGKTSTKHYLHAILGEKYDVLMTPGSYNTPMGVVRTVREYLKPYNEIFICEMGAKQPGDIKEICSIVSPKAGIVTAVGPMHLESFKTIENVCSTKFELVDALPAGGFAVVNNDFEPCAARPCPGVRLIRYGITNPTGCDYIASDIRYTSNGTAFRVEGPGGFSMELETRLLGEANVSDLLAAVAMALQYGVEPSKIRYAVATIEQVEHRLSMKQTPGGVTVIDDAFNSNPVGSKMAVEVLSHFTGGRRIVVTPGMIELGSRQAELNKAFGSHIAANADAVIIVGEYNRTAILDGVREGGMESGGIHLADTFGEAQDILGRIMKAGDTVLYENDLPDTFK